MDATINQQLHREYLRSPLWQSIRSKALEHYGTVCSSCGKFGNDVHHKTYARTGGKELLTDLEVLCRDCHETRHAVIRATRRRGRRPRCRAMRAEAAYRYLSKNQLSTLAQSLGVKPEEIFFKCSVNVQVMMAMEKMLRVRIIERKAKIDKSKVGHESSKLEKILRGVKNPAPPNSP